MLDLLAESFSDLTANLLMRTFHLDHGDRISVDKITGDIYFNIHKTLFVLKHGRIEAILPWEILYWHRLIINEYYYYTYTNVTRDCEKYSIEFLIFPLYCVLVL